MKKSEVEIGGVYTAKVSDKVVEVRIDGENRHGGWDATNLATGKKIHIKSPARLRGAAAHAANGPRGQAAQVDAAAEAPAVEVSAEAAPDAEPKPAKAKRAKGSQPKRLSGLDAAAKVLEESGHRLDGRLAVELPPVAADAKDVNPPGALGHQRREQNGPPTTTLDGLEAHEPLVPPRGHGRVDVRRPARYGDRLAGEPTLAAE